MKLFIFDVMLKDKSGIFLCMLNMIVIILWLVLVFDDGLKKKVFNMVKMIIVIIVRVFEILVFVYWILNKIIFVLRIKYLFF